MNDIDIIYIYVLVKGLAANPYLNGVDGNPLSNKIIRAFCVLT